MKGEFPAFDERTLDPCGEIVDQELISGKAGLGRTTRTATRLRS